MRFKMPKFLERETKFFAFLTFKQLAVLGIVGLVLFVLYYIIPRSIFFVLLFVIGGGASALLFIRIEGIPLFRLVGQFFGYFIGPKKFIWRKKELPPIKLLKEEKKVEKKEKEKGPLKVSPESKLRKLSSKIEMGLR